ncbi:MAG: hypothetical protein NWE83_04680 [Candidatus Bathyarchaeota archaeon]|nr:hypothetical protein [Candidatus Bathyarchaeota archaeon]
MSKMSVELSAFVPITVIVISQAKQPTVASPTDLLGRGKPSGAFTPSC